MPKTEKTTKKSSTAKVEKQIHPKSRKVSQLTKTIHRGEKRQLRKDELGSKLNSIKEKIIWFKNNVCPEKDRYSLVEVSEIVSKYISRFDERLAEINEQNKLNKGLGRHGQYHAAEEKGIKMVKEKEQELFTAGKFEGPDITNIAALKYMKAWDGEVKLLQNIKLRNFKKLTVNIEATDNEGEKNMDE